MSSLQNDTSPRSKISAFIVTFNEEDQIKACLDSLSFCDEIIVVDSFSTDKTKEIATACGAKIIERKWHGYIDQKAFGLSQCTYDWVINLDADERVNSELKESILEVLRKDSLSPIALAGYECNRVVYFLDRWWRRGGWYPEYRLRFLRRTKVSWGGKEPHEKAVPNGPVGKLAGEIEHHSFDDLDDQLRRLVKYSSIAAKEYYESGARVGPIQLLVSPVVRVIKFLLLKQGFREGMAGLIVAVNEGFYTFMKYAKVWEMQRSSKIDERK